jgi:hypothetical protein
MELPIRTILQDAAVHVQDLQGWAIAYRNEAGSTIWF